MFLFEARLPYIYVKIFPEFYEIVIMKKLFVFKNFIYVLNYLTFYIK